jgi:hypothetical protein
MPTLELPERKQVRATVIKEYVQQAGYEGVVCFSCGNAARALQEVGGLYVVSVSPYGGLSANRWWTQGEIQKCWPSLLDATSGHLPMQCMLAYGEALMFRLGKLQHPRSPNDEMAYVVPSGSGETVVALALQYPGVRFVAQYDNSQLWTRYEVEAPLNMLVQALARVEVER